MANTNTVKELYGGINLPFYPQIAALINPQAATAFYLNQNTVVNTAPTNNGVLGGPTQAAIISMLSASNFGGPNSAPVGSIWDNGRPFRIRLFGTVTSVGTPNVTIAFQQVPSAIVAAQTATVLSNSNVIVGATSGAKACIAGTTNYGISIEFQWNSTGQLLTGSISGYVGANLITGAAITPLAVTADTELNFIATAVFSTNVATNTILVEEFVAEVA